MVRSDDRQKDVLMASPLQHDDMRYKEEASKLKVDIDKTEREIVRLITIAERDKRESISYQHKIKKLRDQVQAMADNPQGNFPDEIRRCYSESDLTLQMLADRYSYSLTPPSAYTPTLKSSANAYNKRSLDAENTSPNISPTQSPCNDSPSSKYKGEVLLLTNTLLAKEDELARVRARSTDEAARCSALRSDEEDLKKAVAAEVEKRRKANMEMLQMVERKEREIQRLSVLAERDKRASMYARDLLLSHKRVLSTFVNARSEKRPELLRAINTCDEIVTSPVPTPPLSPSSFGSSSSFTTPSPLSLTPTSPSQLSILVAASSSKTHPVSTSPLRQELDRLLRVDVAKEEELSRVSAIADVEAKHANMLKTKADEMKEIIAAELKEVSEQLERKVKQYRSKLDAAQRIISRAEMERAKSCMLQEDINKLVGALGEVNSKFKCKKNEYTPDKAYFSEFKELSELVPVSVLHASPGGDKEKEKERESEAVKNILHSPTCKSVAFTDSESVYCQKLKDLDILDQEMAKKDRELERLKRVKEAEVARRRLLAEKVRELLIDYEYACELKMRGEREVSRTF